MTIEIHPPHAIRSWKDFFIQLATITIGVLIALSFEGVREWNHHRTLVNQAQVTIRREITENLKEVEGVLTGSLRRRQVLDSAFTFADDMLRDRKSNVHSINLAFVLANVSASSWQTADRTGALDFMDYGEVQLYSKVYSVQELYVTQQRKAVDRVGAALAFLGEGEDPFQAPPKDLELFRQQARALRSDYMIQDQIGEQLSKLYKEALAK